MADPLTQVTDQFAPAPLNFFDAGRAQSITARYGVARRGAAATDELAQSRSREQGMQAERERMERNRIVQTREDEDYADKKQADAERGGFIVDFVKNVDPRDPEYTRKVTEFMAQAPPAIQRDPVTRDVISFYNREADQVDAEKRRMAEIDARFNNDLEKIKIRSQSMVGLKGVDPETIKKYTLPDGTIDPALYYEAGKRERANEMEDFGKKTEITKNARKELLAEDKMDNEQKALYKETKDILINDREAFPSRVSMVQAKAAANPKHENLALDQLKKMPEYAKDIAAAEEWDKNLFENEVLTAQNYDTPEKYIEARGAELTPNAANRRRRVWEYAHQNDAAPAPQTATPPVAAAPEIVFKGRKVRRLPDGGFEYID